MSLTDRTNILNFNLWARVCIHTLILSEKPAVSPWGTAVSRMQAPSHSRLSRTASGICAPWKQSKEAEMLLRWSNKLHGPWAQQSKLRRHPTGIKCLASFFTSSSFLPSSSDAALGRQGANRGLLLGRGQQAPLLPQPGRFSPTVSRQDYMSHLTPRGIPVLGSRILVPLLQHIQLRRKKSWRS